ncbi:unnamed protein product [Cylindrotheca closterium]|uniref:Thioredoxin domain-containing protein n=1 Tax=Cylindrotheca closterium TaxID=2856 RepID=A0AAD2JJ58_9STRA|nr:unnamed protein product [Cylindrotheca closterium]
MTGMIADGFRLRPFSQYCFPVLFAALHQRCSSLILYFTSQINDTDNSEWEKLAGAVKGQAKIAYWDTEQRGRPPALLGEIKGTPTIRFFKPKKQQKTKGSNAQKTVMDYNQERKAKDMKTFLEYSMPNYVERVSFPEDLAKAVAKADKFGLPKAILFPSKPKTSSVIKYLSTEFRRRLLLVEVVPTKKNESIMKEYGINADQLPALVIVKEGTEEQVVYEGKDFTRRKLERFLAEHAKSEPVYKPVDGSGEASEEKKKDKPVHTEF